MGKIVNGRDSINVTCSMLAGADYTVTSRNDIVTQDEDDPTVALVVSNTTNPEPFQNHPDPCYNLFHKFK